MTSVYSINLNFNITIPVKTDFTFKQGDKGITLNLATTGLDTTGTTAKIVFKRSNGTSVEAELTGQTGPSYSYTILGNEFEIPGVVVADLKLYNGDTQRVSTASFIFQVTGDTLDGIGGGTGGYSDQLEQMSQEFENTLEDYIDAFGNTAPINPCGDYDSATTYYPRDMVYDSNTGTSWVCKQESTGNIPANGSAYWQKLVNSTGSIGLDDLDDVSASSPSDGDVLTYDNNSGEWVPAALPAPPTVPEDLDDLDDVSAASPTNGQVLKYNSTLGKWEAAQETSLGLIASVQTSLIAIRNYEKGEQFIYNGALYKAISDISSGGAITIGGNCDLSGTITEQIICKFINIDAADNTIDLQNMTVKQLGAVHVLDMGNARSSSAMTSGSWTKVAQITDMSAYPSVEVRNSCVNNEGKFGRIRVTTGGSIEVNPFESFGGGYGIMGQVIWE